MAWPDCGGFGEVEPEIYGMVMAALVPNARSWGALKGSTRNSEQPFCDQIDK